MKKNFDRAARVFSARALVLMASLLFLPSWASPARLSVEAAPLDPVVEAPAEAAIDGRDAVEVDAESARAIVPAFEDWPAKQAAGIDARVLRLALNAATCAVRSGAAESPETLTVIDYSKPSSERRMWVYDLRSRALLYHELVAHGQGSGANIATQFSNLPETHRTSIGLFVTDDTYVGRNGYSLRLNGLDRGFNDRARERAIVMHGAPYVSAAFVKQQGRLGRSHGCPAVRADVARELIDRVKGGDLVFSYYPDPKWLSSSKYLGGCGAN